MNLYLANIQYEVSHYMGDDVQHNVSQLVKANSVEEAREKARKYYEDQTSEYSIYYLVKYVNIMDTIE